METSQGISPTAAAVKLMLATLAAGLVGSASAAPDNTRMIVAFKPGAATAAKAAIKQARGADAREIFGMNAVSVALPAAALNALQANPNIDYVEEDVIRTPFALATPSTAAPTRSASWCPTVSRWSRPTTCPTQRPSTARCASSIRASTPATKTCPAIP